jgi:hypothetical protein
LNARQLARIRPGFTGLVLLAEGAHLLWQHLHGGVVSHHLLQRADLPAISNAWGALLLPALTWFLLGRTRKRLLRRGDADEAASKAPDNVPLGFFGALIWGGLLAAAFTGNLETITSSLFFGALVLALVLPVYRAECLLGFVLGMAFTFGAVLPTLVGSVIAGLSAGVHLGLRPVLVRLWKRLSAR